MNKLTDYRYLQKSKLFLLPLLELKKDIFIKPINTYLREINKQEEYRLILPFKKDDSSEFNYYENTYIVPCKYLDQQNYYETEHLRVYYFDLSPLKSDFDKFLQGKYTEFSNRTKSFINMHWGKIAGQRFFPHPIIDSYINPALSDYEEVASYFSIPVEELIKIKEVIDPPDLTRETFDPNTVKNTVIESQD